MKLYLDLGATTGYALVDGDEIYTGSIKFSHKKDSRSSIRFLRFFQWLETMPEVEHVVYEEVMAHAGIIAAQMYGAFRGITQMWCERGGRTYSYVHVGTLKKAATGKGNASKEMMIEAARAAGYDPVDDNEADAICMMLNFGGE